MNSPTAAISLTQIAALADLCPEYFARHADSLPPTHPVHTGSRGRPQKAFDIDDLAALIVARTGHLSEAVVRLRLALAMGASVRIVQVNDKHVLVRDDEDLQDLDPAVAQAVLDQIHEHNELIDRRRTRRHPATEESQP
ncbi:hypothetical protein [Pseudomonas sp. NBRC 111140]|uniref:hypothetical protein n=1 Tax=Pseudomonas sp. NBRC 111140 TaxID=1661055 RepID=UPI0007619AEB|nr:hypothetical protein [Pseudomonas sp. NBRC 111140]